MMNYEITVHIVITILGGIFHCKYTYMEIIKYTLLETEFLLKQSYIIFVYL